MEFVNGKDLVASNGMEAKDYWVHVDAEGPLEKYPGQSVHEMRCALPYSNISETTCPSCTGEIGH